jgi:Family of unknown function (DUF6232)
MADINRETLEIRISRRILWVGDEAFPLQHVIRVHPAELHRKYFAICRRYFRRARVWFALTAVWLVYYLCAGWRTNVAFMVGFGLVLVAGYGWLGYRFVRTLTDGRYYALVLEFARPRKVLVSKDRELVYDLARRITDAIDNPAAEFAMSVENIVFGDQIHNEVYGDQIHTEGPASPGKVS